MLVRLHVENYALIDRLDLEPDARLNIITGETGAGKSILLGALGLLMGARSDTGALLDKERNCVVEGIFRIKGLDLEEFFDANGLDWEEEIAVRRILTPAGKSRSFVGDLPVQLTTVRELGARLIDIHSQHRNLILQSEAFRTQALDTLAGNGALRERYAAAYARTGELRRSLEKLRDEAAAAARDQEWLRYQVEELTEARLRTGEQAELEEQQAMLAHAGSIGEKLDLLRTTLDDERSGVLPQLKHTATELARIGDHYPAAAAWSERIRQALVELRDVGDEASEAADRIEADPARLEKIDSRLAILYALCQKHRMEGSDELIPLRDRFAARLEAIDRGGERIAELERQLAEAELEARASADALHARRSEAAPQFEREVIATLERLGMAGTLFRIGLAPAEGLTPSGCDRVDYLFSADRNALPQPVEKIASGGELSRVMLAIKALLAKRMQLPTILFDEIDAGVSGRIADAMGQIIHDLSRTMQVIDITHLPQVASKGETHLVVYKEAGRTRIARLTQAQRVREIAKMLSGSEVTDAALAQARILLGRSGEGTLPL